MTFALALSFVNMDAVFCFFFSSCFKNFCAFFWRPLSGGHAIDCVDALFNVYCHIIRSIYWHHKMGRNARKVRGAPKFFACEANCVTVGLYSKL